MKKRIRVAGQLGKTTLCRRLMERFGDSLYYHLGAKDCVTGSCHLIEAWPGPVDSVDILIGYGPAPGNDPVMPLSGFLSCPKK